MFNPHKTLPWMFNLEGTFLGFIDSDSENVKSIGLEVDQETIAIKLPKKLRESAQQRLQPGDRVYCIGRSQVDPQTKTIKLNASHLFSVLPEATCTGEAFKSEPPKLTQTPTPPIPLSPTLPISPSYRSRPKPPQKKAKVLICRKSGCQKRGGRQLVAKLEQTLCERQLQDVIEIQYVGCQKRCSKAPNLTIMPGKHRYDRLSLDSLPALVEEHFCRP